MTKRPAVAHRRRFASKASLIASLVAVVFAITVVLIGGWPSTNSGPHDDVEIIRLPTRWTSGLANDLNTLVDASDHVFVGQVLSSPSQRLESLGPDEFQGRSKIPISLFRVHVESALNGDLRDGDIVTIEQIGGGVTLEDQSPAFILLGADEMLQPGESYLFFANSAINDSGNLTTNPYARLKVEPNNTLSALPEWQHLGALSDLAGQGLQEAQARVSGAVE